MKAPAASYQKGALAMLANSVLGALSGFLSLWFLNQILTKEMFGAYSVAMNAVFLAAIVAMMGLNRAFLLRIAGIGGPPDILRGGGLALRAGMVVAVAASVVAVILASVADLLVQAGATPDLALWLPALSLAVIPIALTGMVQGWLLANHRASTAVLLPGLADIARAGFIGLAFVLSAGPQGVALAVVMGACLPLAVAALWINGARRRRTPRRLGAGDFGNGALFMLQNLSVFGMRYVDLLILGLVATGSVIADYAVAGRLATAVDLGWIVLKPTFTPRARRHLRNGDDDRLAREYHALRLGGFVLALLAAGLFAVFGQWLLGLFGPYDSAYGPLLLLCAVHVITAGTGMHSSYLSMSGEVAWSAGIRVGSLVGLVALILVLAPVYGALGAAAAMMAVQGAVNGLSVLLLWWLRGFVAVPFVAACLLMLAIAALLAGATSILSPYAVGGTLFVLACAAAISERGAARDLLRLLRRPKEPAA